MYWLLFYNGHEVPIKEAAFAYDFLLVEYAKAFISFDLDYSKNYFVFSPDKTTPIPLEKFIKCHEEV